MLGTPSGGLAHSAIGVAYLRLLSGGNDAYLYALAGTLDGEGGECGLVVTERPANWISRDG